MAVNLSPVGGVAAQFFTNTGAVLTGGKLYTYAAGTTTPAATYTSSNGLTAWTNPVVLDAAGRVPSGGEIWLTDGIIYKFVLKDSNDVLIATYDNITGINSNSVSYTNSQEIITATAGQTVFDLSISYQPATNSLSVFVDGVNQYGPGALYSYVETDSNTVTFNSGLHVGAEVKFTTTQQQGAGAVDASQVSYTPAGTGAVTTNVQTKLRQTVSVKDFGAVGDGVADDTAAIQAAIAACSAIVDGTLRGTKLLYFPSGTYLCDGAIGAMPCSCVGENRNTTFLKYTGTTAPFITFGDASYTGLHFKYTNTGLTGNFTEEQLPGIFTDCFWSGNDGVSAITTAECCITVNKALQVEFNKCHFTDAAHGVLGQINPHIDGFSNGITISNCIFGNYLSGAIKNGGQAWTIQGCIFEFNPSNEVQAIITDGFSDWFGAMVTGCWFGDYTALTGKPYIQWKGNGLSVVGNYINGSGSNAPWFMEISGNSKGICVTGNYISNFDRIVDAGAYTVEDLFIFGNNLNTITTSFVGTPTGSYIIKDYAGTNYTAMGRTVFSNVSVGDTTNKTTANIVATNTAIDGGNLTAQQYIGSTQALGAGVGGGLALGGVYNGSGDQTFGGGITVGKENATDGEYGFNTYIWSRANGQSGNSWLAIEAAGNTRPTVDNAKSIGTASYRWSVVYAGTGTINTSDANEKQQIRSLNEAEKAVAVRIKSLVKAFKFNNAVEEKGDKARIHFGVLAQEIKTAFEAENLNAENYGLFCSDVLEDGSVRLGIRYDELLMFIVSAI